MKLHVSTSLTGRLLPVITVLGGHTFVHPYRDMVYYQDHISLDVRYYMIGGNQC